MCNKDTTVFYVHGHLSQAKTLSFAEGDAVARQHLLSKLVKEPVCPSGQQSNPKCSHSQPLSSRLTGLTSIIFSINQSTSFDQGHNIFQVPSYSGNM